MTGPQRMLIFMSLVLAVFGLVYLKDPRWEYRRAAYATVVIGPLGLAFFAFAFQGAILALAILAGFAGLAAWRLRS